MTRHRQGAEVPDARRDDQRTGPGGGEDGVRDGELRLQSRRRPRPAPIRTPKNTILPEATVQVKAIWLQLKQKDCYRRHNEKLILKRRS